MNNLMSEVAKMLGVEIGEEFIIENADHKKTVVLAMDGLRIPFSHGMAEMDDGRLLLKVLEGHYEVKKKPWKPKNGDKFYTIGFSDVTKPYITWYIWSGHAVDYTRLKLGLAYRTEKEASACMADDYEKLTGKKLGVQNNE